MLECGEDWGAGEGLAVQNMGGSVVHWQVGMLLVVIPPPQKRNTHTLPFFYPPFQIHFPSVSPLSIYLPPPPLSLVPPVAFSQPHGGSPVQITLC